MAENVLVAVIVLVAIIWAVNRVVKSLRGDLSCCGEKGGCCGCCDRCSEKKTSKSNVSEAEIEDVEK